MWFQYVIGYDQQEQRSLATSLHNQLFDLRRTTSASLNRLKQSAPELVRPIVLGLIILIALIAGGLMARRIRALGWRRGVRVWQSKKELESSRVDFYERLVALLEKRGIKRESYQTPLEFATALGITEARAITNAYNRVRYGTEKLSTGESKEIEELLSVLERRREET
jgi:hypothetical protein